MGLRERVIKLAHAKPELRPHLLPLLAVKGRTAFGRGTYVPTKELPDFIRRALKEVKYGSRDIEVKPATTYTVSGLSGQGRQSFTVAVNLRTGKYQVEYGSWGGPNPFNPQNPVDLDNTPRPIPKDGAIIKGLWGGRPTWAYILVHPDNLVKLIPSGEEPELTDKEQAALNIMSGIKSSYRKEEFWRKKLGPYSLDNPVMQSLLDKGLIKVNRGGAMMITLKGKNLAKRVW